MSAEPSADEPDVHNSAEYVASTLQLRRAGFGNFAMKCQTSSTPLRTAALRSSPMLAERLTQAESKPAAEEERATLNLMQMSAPQSPQFHEHFVATASRRFKENARETRATLRELVDGEVRLVPTDGLQELVVRCALSRTTLPVLSSRALFNVVRAVSAIESGRSRDALRERPEIYTQAARTSARKSLKCKKKYKVGSGGSILSWKSLKIKEIRVR
jgi:hypothetical protein